MASGFRAGCMHQRVKHPQGDPDLIPPHNILSRTKENGNKKSSVWDRLRHMITYLYVKKGFKLQKIRDLMARKYGHDATIQMYKKRLVKWGVRKNYTQKQKRDALAYEHQARFSTFDVPVLMINDMPIKKQRLRRAVQYKYQLRRLSPARHARSYQSLQTTPESVPDSPREAWLGSSARGVRDCFVPRSWSNISNSLYISRCQCSMVPSPFGPLGYCKAECFFLYTHQYYHGYCSQNLSGWAYAYTTKLANVFESLRVGRQTFLKDIQLSRGWFKRAYGALDSMVTAQPFQMLNQLIVEFSNPWWASQRMLLLAVLGHVSRTACLLLGPDHPLARAIRLLVNTDVLRHAALPAMEIATDVIDAGLGPSQDNIWRVKLAYLISMLEMKDLKHAERYCWDIIRHAREQRRDRTSWVELHALEKLAWIRFNQGQDAEAELLCLEVLQRNLQRQGGPSTKTVGTDACLMLLQLSKERGNYELAELWQSMRLEGALCKEEPNYPIIFQRLQELENILEKQGKNEAIRELREDLKDIYQHWDGLDVHSETVGLV